MNFLSRESFGFFLSLAAAFFLWFLTFVLRPFDFWLNMSFNASLLAFFAFYFSRKKIIGREEFTARNVFWGIFSALALYVIFWFGRKIISVIPGNSEMLSSVYLNGWNTSRVEVGALLFFPIGFGEEIFWRGFIQRKLYSVQPRFFAVLTASFFYTAVHIPTLNPVLILASLVCGLYWGMLYACTGSLFPVLLSHMIWDPLIFAFAPIR